MACRTYGNDETVVADVCRFEKGAGMMVLQAYWVKKTIPDDKTVTLTGLPFATGDQVEIVIVRQAPPSPREAYPLRGQSVQYERPLESVAETDWEVLR